MSRLCAGTPWQKEHETGKLRALCGEPDDGRTGPLVAQLGSFLCRHLCQKLLFAFHAHLEIVLVIRTLWSEEQRIRKSGTR